MGLVQDSDPNPYWTKYRRFLDANGFEYSLFDIHRHDWMAQAASFDAIVWRPMSDPTELDEARRKVYVLERHMGLKCLPSFQTVMTYEDKQLQSYQLAYHGVPVIPTFITNDRDDAMAYLARASFPIVSKLSTGSGSLGVSLIDRPSTGRRFVDTVFSAYGRSTYWGFERQRGYVLFQEFIPSDGYDLRIIIVGEWVFGYYRKASRSDFRASGSGVYEKRALPEDAMRLALRVAGDLRESALAVDLLRDTSGKLLVNEVSAFIQVDTAEQLVVDGVPGAYRFRNDTFEFVEGRRWIQELALRAFLWNSFVGCVR